MGGPLFVRSNRGLRLTPRGIELNEKIERSQLAWHGPHEAEAQTTFWTIKFGAHEAIALNYLPKVYELLIRLGTIAPELELAPSREVTRKIAEGELDIGLVMDPERFSSLVCQRVLSEPLCIFGREESSPGTESILFFNPDQIRLAESFRKAKVRRRIPVRNYDMIARLVSEGLGIGLIPQGVANRYNGLRVLHEPLLRPSLYLVAHEEKLREDRWRRLYREILNGLRANGTKSKD